MRKKMIIAGIAGVVVIFFAGWYVMFRFLGIGPDFPLLPMKEMEEKSIRAEASGESSLMALVDTEEEAQEIAGLYGIELTSCSEGVATYSTQEDPNEVIARGERNGYPPVYLNLKRSVS